MPVKYFASKVIVIDFPSRDNRGQNNEQSECYIIYLGFDGGYPECLLRPQLFIPTVPV
jgi:hypothetical protein